jgi:hypothetical protein
VRRYDDPVEVRRGEVPAAAGGGSATIEGPEQFLWRGRLWQVRSVVAQWVETGSWWQSPGVRAVIGSVVDGEDSSELALEAAGRVRHSGRATGRVTGRGGALATLEPDLLTSELSSHDLLREREVWRVEAASARGYAAVRDGQDDPGFGVFDLVFSWSGPHGGAWRLTGCLD